MFNLDFSKKHIVRAINSMCSRAYNDYRYKLHRHYKSFQSHTEARRHPSPLVTQSDWEILCSYFQSEPCKVKSRRGTTDREHVKNLHSSGSKTFVQRLHEMEEPSLIENYKITHCKTGTSVWLSHEALQKYNQMKEIRDNDVDHDLTEEEIVGAVLGRRPGFVAGYGGGEVPKTAWTYDDGVSESLARAEAAEKKASAYRRRAEAERRRAVAAERRNEVLEKRISNVEKLILKGVQLQEDYESDAEEESERESEEGSESFGSESQ